MVEVQPCELFYTMEKLSLPPDKTDMEKVEGVGVNEVSLYKVAKEENKVISDWLRATDEENFSELNSDLRDCEDSDSGIGSNSSGYESSDFGEEISALEVINIGIQVNRMINTEVDKSLQLHQEVLVNNEKLREALKDLVERHKKVKMKYSAVVEELKMAEETVRDVTSIEFDLRKILKSREKEIELVEEEFGRFKKIRFEEEEKSGRK